MTERGQGLSGPRDGSRRSTSGDGISRAIAYVRVSTEEQARGGVSLDAQDAACRAYCQAKGLNLVEVLRDEGVTSGIPLLKRPAGGRLRRLVADGEARHVVAYSISRLFRNNAEALLVSEEWDGAGVALHLLDIGGSTVDTGSPLGRFFFSIIAGAAELERNMLRERVKGALQHIANTGRAPTGRRYGYRREDGRLVPEPAEAAVVKRIYERFDEGDGYSQIARALTADGVPTPRSAEVWLPTTIRVILRQPLYIGLVRHNGDLLPGDHEALIDDDLWERARARIALRRGGGPGPLRHLTGLFSCGFCGSRMSRKNKGRPPHRHTYMACFRYRIVPKEERHAFVSIASRKAEAILWRHTEVICQPDGLRVALGKYREEAAASRRDDVPARELAEVEREIEMNMRFARDGALPVDMLLRANQELAARREALRQQLSESSEPPGVAVFAELLELNITSFLSELKERPAEAQLGFLKSLYPKVEVLPDRLVFHHAAEVLPPIERPAPKYWSPERGRDDLGF